MHINPLQAIDRMKSEFQSEKEKGTEGVTQTVDLTIEFMQLDLTSLNSTKTFTEQFKTSGRKLNVVVCNAGIAYAPLGNKVKNKKIPHCRNNSKIKYHNHRKAYSIDRTHKYLTAHFLRLVQSGPPREYLI